MWASAIGFAAALLLGLTGCRTSSSPFPLDKPVTDARQGPHKAYQESVGDTWDPTWADDDNLYAASDDGSG